MEPTFADSMKTYLCLLIDPDGKACGSNRIQARSLADAYIAAEQVMHDSVAAGYELWLSTKLMAMAGSALAVSGAAIH